MMHIGRAMTDERTDEGDIDAEPLTTEPPTAEPRTAESRTAEPRAGTPLADADPLPSHPTGEYQTGEYPAQDDRHGAEATDRADFRPGEMRDPPAADDTADSTADDEPATPTLPATTAPTTQPTTPPTTAVAVGNPSSTSPLDELLGGAETLRSRWASVQATFVDDPGDSVRAADALVGETVHRLTDALTAETAGLSGGWRGGPDAGDGPAAPASTEELRLALQRYRKLFDRLLAV
jgi:hypothetical protein